ncbi:WD40-repeat-containing domain protein [Collybia nuda]|uniref:WD40-repeat-containing domain protein n=1 Tax=Collybia nuda TaxID=64659 RepID=A0A9P5YKQ2_9AGAR|nr:WD40-repeat-containing domain protein [Collybia nuda]
MDSFAPIETFTLVKTLETPSHISSLAFGHAGHLFAGSDDGSVRVYDLSSFKVVRAIRGLGAEVSSIVCFKRPGSELRDAWLGCGKQALSFQLDTPKMIQTLEDASSIIELGESAEDILNELSLNITKSHLAFSTDSGVVGVVDLSTKVVSRMKTRHESVCGSVKFIPDRSREIVSGGYDTALLHFDFEQGSVLSSLKMPAPEAAAGNMALAPPFIMSSSISSAGLLAAGTADGRLWIGLGGRKRLSPGTTKKKRTKQWDGLKQEEALIVKIAEGPVVAMSFDESGVLTVSTLLGMLTRFKLKIDDEDGSVGLDKTWHQDSRTSIEKVNTLLVDDKRIIVGGLTAKGKGVIEIWRQSN